MRNIKLFIGITACFLTCACATVQRGAWKGANRGDANRCDKIAKETPVNMEKPERYEQIYEKCMTSLGYEKRT